MGHLTDPGAIPGESSSRIIAVISETRQLLHSQRRKGDRDQSGPLAVGKVLRDCRTVARVQPVSWTKARIASSLHRDFHVSAKALGPHSAVVGSHDNVPIR